MIHPLPFTFERGILPRGEPLADNRKLISLTVRTTAVARLTCWRLENDALERLHKSISKSIKSGNFEFKTLHVDDEGRVASG